MKRLILGVLALVVAVSATASAQTDEERRELERRLRELQSELREVELQLGRERGLLEMIEPLTLSVLGNRARLGVVVNTGRDSDTDSMGAVLEAVTPDGPADEAGLEVGDILVSLNGISLLRTSRRDDSPGDKVSEFSGELEEGDEVAVVYLRDGETHTTTLIARPVSSFAYRYSAPGRLQIDDSGVMVLGRGYTDSLARSYRGIAENLRDRIRVQTWDAEPGTGTAWSMSFGGRMGDLELTTLDENLGAYFGTTEGLLVVRAPEEEWLNLRSGDVILRIGGRLPRSPSQALRILRSFEPGDEIQLDIMRNKQRTSVTATVQEGDRGFFWDEGK
jgi:type II secretory pathway pseudopilin PulG